jgi:hypothetical protein
LASLAPAAPAGANFDIFESETLNDLNSFGQEIPYVSGAPRQFTTASFDTSTFGLDSTEDSTAAGQNLNGCLKTGGPVFGGRTAWARFNPGVDGQIRAQAQTPGYDSIVWIREAREVAWGTTTFSDVRGRSNGCTDTFTSDGNEETALHASADMAYYVQVGAKCAGDATTCNPPAEPGGPTVIRLTFTPDDSDQDGVPDTQDACPGGAAGLVTSDGCPDVDQDGIRDDQEGPGCVGQRGVPAAAPYNGCLDGPNPPSTSPPAVVITGRDGNPDNTSSVDVELSLNWPKGTRQAVASNGTAVTEAIPIALAAKVPWKLRPATKSEAREVKVTFLGPGIQLTVSDIITLDPVPPRVTKYLLTPTARTKWYLGANTTDDRSGVRRLEALDARRRLIRRVEVCRRPTSCSRRVSRALDALPRRPRFLNVTDAAGNLTRKVVAVAAGCRIKVLVTKTRDPVDTVCKRPGDRCTARGYAWARAYPSLKCTRGRVRPR